MTRVVEIQEIKNENKKNPRKRYLYILLQTDYCAMMNNGKRVQCRKTMTGEERSWVCRREQ